MKPKVIFIERKTSSSVSIERVFRKVARHLGDEFDVEFQPLPYGYGVLAIIKNLVFFRPRPADVYHVTGDVHYISLKLPAEKTVLTIHDLVALGRRSGLRGWFIKKLFFILPTARLKHITAVSESTQLELADITDIDKSKIDVIGNPLDDCFVPNGKRTFDEACPTILHVGTADNKNLPRLIRAVAGLNCKLRIVGGLDEKARTDLAQTSVNYEDVADLDDLQMVQEYRNADILSFCSTYEGFGLPIIEAQAVGTAVVTSDLSPMKEVAGNGAVLVDPREAKAIRNAIDRLIGDSEYREGLIRNGLENVKRFAGGPIAEKYARIYRSIVAEANHG